VRTAVIMMKINIIRARRQLLLLCILSYFRKGREKSWGNFIFETTGRAYIVCLLLIRADELSSRAPLHVPGK